MLLARWLITEPRLLILDEPTRGIDVGAKAEIQRLVVVAVRRRDGVLFISAELEEVLRLSHKIVVLRDRQWSPSCPTRPTLDATRSCRRSRAELNRDMTQAVGSVDRHRCSGRSLVLVALLLVNLVFRAPASSRSR